jgi:hypothetical protein
MRSKMPALLQAACEVQGGACAAARQIATKLEQAVKDAYRWFIPAGAGTTRAEPTQARSRCESLEIARAL